MRLMARRATFELYWRVLERKRAPLVAMAFEASRLIAVDRSELLQARSAMRIVAVHAGHRAFGYRMMMRPLELRHHVRMATLTDLRDFRRSRVDGVASGALHLIPAMG